MVNVILSGCGGKMGKVVSETVKSRSDIKIVAGVDKFSAGGLGYNVYESFVDIKESADVIIDFSHPSLFSSLVSFSKDKKIPVVMCTTGLSREQIDELYKLSEDVAVFYSANMSLGVNLIIDLCKKAASALYGSFDIEIIEKHHNQKIDAPSGTALMIADAMKSVLSKDIYYELDRASKREKRSVNEIGISAVRGGNIVGEHEVIFAGKDEVISISHKAYSKEIFALGAVNAAVYLAGRKSGLYNMESMLKEIL